MDCNEKEIGFDEEKKIILNFTGCKNLDDVHHLLKKQFGFPDYYGENLSALWDCLDYYCNYRLRVEIKELRSLPNELHEDIMKIMKIFDDVHKRSPNITFEIISKTLAEGKNGLQRKGKKYI